EYLPGLASGLPLVASPVHVDDGKVMPVGMAHVAGAAWKSDADVAAERACLPIVPDREVSELVPGVPPAAEERIRVAVDVAVNDGGFAAVRRIVRIRVDVPSGYDDGITGVFPTARLAARGGACIDSGRARLRQVHLRVATDPLEADRLNLVRRGRTDV